MDVLYHHTTDNVQTIDIMFFFGATVIIAPITDTITSGVADIQPEDILLSIGFSNTPSCLGIVESREKHSSYVPHTTGMSRGHIHIHSHTRTTIGAQSLLLLHLT